MAARVQIGGSVTTTPTAASPTLRPRLDVRDHRLAVVFGVWMVVGLFLDGWAHDNGQPESFFTPWHGVLYSGFAGAAAAAVWPVLRHRTERRVLTQAVPVGHGLTLVALAAFSVGAIGDLVWHETLGVEVGVEALLSPTHLLLLVSGIAALSAPFRAAWLSDDADISLRSFLPAVLSVTLTTAVIGFFMVYLSPFVNDAAGSAFERAANTPHEHPATDPRELLQLLGLGSILMTSVLIASATQLLLRRWVPPRGSFTLMLGLMVFLFVALDEFGQPPLLLAGVLAGAATDFAARRIPDWVVPAVAVAVLWLSYFAIYEAALGGVTWTAELWTGAVTLATLLALAVGFIGRRTEPLRGPVPVE